MLGDTLTTYIGNDPNPVVTTRVTQPPPPESDNSFIDHHGRNLYARIHGTSGVTVLTNDDLAVSLERESGQGDEVFVAAFCALLKAAA